MRALHNAGLPRQILPSYLDKFLVRCYLALYGFKVFKDIPSEGLLDVVLTLSDDTVFLSIMRVLF